MQLASSSAIGSEGIWTKRERKAQPTALKNHNAIELKYDIPGYCFSLASRTDFRHFGSYQFSFRNKTVSTTPCVFVQSDIKYTTLIICPSFKYTARKCTKKYANSKKSVWTVK